MQISVTGKGTDLHGDLLAHAEPKLRKLERYLRHIQSVQITQSQQRSWHIVEIQVSADNFLARSEERAADLRSALDLALDRLERQVKKYHSKLVDRARLAAREEHVGAPSRGEKPALAAEALDARTAEERPDEEAEEAQHIVRTKRFVMKPMSAEEAAAQMELLGHDFFVFQSAETGQVNVLYRRRDGHYGLIEPEV